MYQYEAMFLFDPTFATDFGAAKTEVERLLGRAGAEVVFLEKWEERKLAYEIKGRKRGVYVLVYFKCDGGKISALERDAQLSEPILRALVRRADGITREQIEKFMPSARRADESFDDAGPPSRGPRSHRDDDGGGAGARRRQPAAVAVADDDAVPDLDE